MYVFLWGAAFIRFYTFFPVAPVWPMCGPCVAHVWPMRGPCVAPVGRLEIRQFSLHNPFTAGGKARWAPTDKYGLKIWEDLQHDT